MNQVVLIYDSLDFLKIMYMKNIHIYDNFYSKRGE